MQRLLDKVQYYALITHEDGRTLAAFPDCPGCQTFAEDDEEIQANAAEALEVWLESILAHGEVPPRPDNNIGLKVSVPSGLAVKVVLSWLNDLETDHVELVATRLAATAGLGVARGELPNYVKMLAQWTKLYMDEVLHV